MPDEPPREVEPGITVIPCRQLLHHQLRVSPWLHRLNAAFVARDLRRGALAASVPSSAKVINFAHDYWFLRDVFPGARVTTIIHDDFEAQSRLGFHGHVTWSLRRTCESSDRVLAVSTPLQRGLSAWHETELFLPWAVEPYREPSSGTTRDTLLFWASSTPPSTRIFSPGFPGTSARLVQPGESPSSGRRRVGVVHA